MSRTPSYADRIYELFYQGEPVNDVILGGHWRADGDGTLVIGNGGDTTLSTEMITSDNEGWPRWPWREMSEPVTSVRFDGTVTAIDSLSGLLMGLEEATTIDLTGLDTSQATSMSGMFSGCSSVASLDLSPLDTSHVTSMSGMFSGCSSVASFDLSPLDTSHVTDISDMFAFCSALESIDLTGLDTSNVTTMANLLLGCYGLRTVDLTGLDTSNVTDMSGMFEHCFQLVDLRLGGIDTSAATNMHEMFWQCFSLPGIDVSSFDTSHVTDMSSMFAGCYGLEELDLSSFDTSHVTNMREMFDVSYAVLPIEFDDLAEDPRLRRLDLSSFDTSACTNMTNFASGQNSLTDFVFPSFRIPPAKDAREMFAFCQSLEAVEVTLSEPTVKYVRGRKWDEDELFAHCWRLGSVRLHAPDGTGGMRTVDLDLTDGDTCKAWLGIPYSDEVLPS